MAIEKRLVELEGDIEKRLVGLEEDVATIKEMSETLAANNNRFEKLLEQMEQRLSYYEKVKQQTATKTNSELLNTFGFTMQQKQQAQKQDQDLVDELSTVENLIKNSI